MLNEAALEAVRRGGDIITSVDVYNGMDRILQVLMRWGQRTELEVYY